MLRLIGIALSIGFVDSLNPTTIAPALLLATAPRARHSVLMFTAGAFCAYFFGGLLIALGPGELILALVPAPSHNMVQVIEVIAGIVLIVAGLLLWHHRVVLSRREMPVVEAGKRTGFWLGVTIMLVELPTAFPYFGVLATVISSHRAIPLQVGLVLIFNLMFVLPLLAIYALLWIYGERADEMINRYRSRLQRYWPLILAVIVLAAGGIVIMLGVTGIVRRTKLLQHAGRLLHTVMHRLK